MDSSNARKHLAVPTMVIKNTKYMRVTARTTVCILTMANGFEIVGTSSCIDEENYNESIGNSCAYEDALKKVQDYLAYQVKELEYQSPLLDS